MTLSPDGRWLAYVSEESGTSEIYVRPFPEVDSARFAISSGGGIEPLWRRDGRELFYRTTRGEVFATAISDGPGFQHGAPVRLFSLPDMQFQQYHRTWDIHPDGRRFLMLRTTGTAAQSLSVIFNWQVENREAPEGGEVNPTSDRLIAALADRYRIERELGAGGMATSSSLKRRLG